MITSQDRITRLILLSCVVVTFIASYGMTTALAQVLPPITNPTTTTTLNTATVTFTGDHEGGGERHWAYVGDTPDGNEYFGGAPDANHQFTASDLTATGTIYFRYFTLPNPTGAWENQTHSYTMDVSGTDSGGDGGSDDHIGLSIDHEALDQKLDQVLANISNKREIIRIRASSPLKSAALDLVR